MRFLSWRTKKTGSHIGLPVFTRVLGAMGFAFAATASGPSSLPSSNPSHYVRVLVFEGRN